MLPSSFAAWQGVLAGAFIAFFAFIGFESLATMAEEAKDPRRTVPYSIVGAVLVSTLLYVVVAAAAGSPLAKPTPTAILSGKFGPVFKRHLKLQARAAGVR